MNRNLQKILSNKIVLYIVFGLSIIQLLHFLFLNRFDYIIVFGLISYLVYYFSKNMILVLGVPLLIVTIQLWLFKEGFEGEKDSYSEDSSSGKKKSKKYSSSGNNVKGLSSSNSKSTESSPSEIVHPIQKENTEDMNESQSPSEENVSEEESHEEEFDPNQINYATTMTDNLKMYNSVLGSDGFAQMTSDTQELLRQQESLGRNMQQFAPMIQQMTPFLEKASQLLSGVDMNQLNAATNIFKSK
jgi:hypothetical protein